MGRPRTLPSGFYDRPTLALAQALLGQHLISDGPDGRTAGRIVETEAYHEREAACHAARGETPRTRVMFGPAGVAYVYFIYGMYHCVNVVSEGEGVGAAVLIRALEPLEGLDLMRQRRGRESVTALASGPGKLCIALGVGGADNGVSLRGRRLWIAPGEAPREAVQVTTRVGIKVARELPWRFCLSGNPHVSRGRPSAVC